MKIYVAGPMTGIPFFNYPAFNAAAARLRGEGHEVFNPAENDIATYGCDVSNPTGDVAQAAAEHGFDRRAILKTDLAWICEHAEAIHLLPGWRNSTGALAEHALGVALGLTLVEMSP